VTWTYYQGYKDSIAFAKSLHHLGITERKAVNICGFNSPEWCIAYHGSIFYNCVVSGVYNTNQPEACHYQAVHSECEVVCVDTIANLKKYSQHLEKMPEIKHIVVWMEDAIPEEHKHPKIMLWRDFMQIGKNVPDSIITEKMLKQSPGSCSTLVYTSGTTGNPKGVMLSHDNLCWSIQSIFSEFSKDQQWTSSDRIVSYLPLSHIAGLIVDVMGQALYGHCVYFARPDAL
jgi:long-chain-fatty-acid--CoA ligase ACSBG